MSLCCTEKKKENKCNKEQNNEVNFIFLFFFYLKKNSKYRYDHQSPFLASITDICKDAKHISEYQEIN